ncbi:ATP-binding protein, partial [Dialister sp.]|uniref:ATP-binding protein n=1 Tax=Dialister sp. TaxID=1955814 RepID=UPI002E80060E
TQYESYIEINFILQKEYRTIFDDGYEVDKILKNMTFIHPEIRLIPHKTLIFFDEIQVCINGATSLKAFKIDGRYDVICSGSLMGINYGEIESNSVGYKQDVVMHSLDFEEFLWAQGYGKAQIDDLYDHMESLLPLSETQMHALHDLFLEYMVAGGMPDIVSRFVNQGNYSGILAMQQQILLDYEEDITKYAGGLDKARILNVYRAIPVFLGQSNKKFQISKVARNARSRDYVGVVEWLSNAGIVNICYNLDRPELPLKGNYNPKDFKLYFGDPGLLVASLDEEVQEDLRFNKNFNIYKGALYENVAADMLTKAGFPLFFYRNPKSTVEMDFMVRDRDSLVPVEIKAQDGATPSLNHLITKDTYEDIHYGIKLGNKNISFNGKFYTFPYFLTFLLKKFLKDRGEIKA